MVRKTKETALLQKVQELNKQKDYTAVVDLLPEDLLKEYQNADIYAELARTYFGLKEYEKSKRMADDALSINPNQTNGLYYLATYFANKKERESAKKHYEKAIEIDPEYSNPYYGLGILYFNLKEYEKAKEQYLKAIEIDPEYSYPCNGLGNIYRNQKEYEKAKEQYLKAIKIDPDFSHPYNGLGNIYSDLKQYEKAEKQYLKAIEIDPEYSNPYYGLGILYYNLKEYQKAEKHYLKAIEIDPEFSYPYNGLGNVYLNLKEYQKAEKHYLKAIEIDPEYATPIYNLGLLYEKLDKKEAALAQFNQAIEYGYDDFFVFYNLAVILDDLGKDDEAISYYEHAINHPDTDKDFYKDQARDKIAEIEKRTKDPVYAALDTIVEDIKECLVYADGLVTHYTSLSTTKFLVLHDSPFRLSEGAFLNDTSEGRELLNFLDFHLTTQDQKTLAEEFSPKPFIGSFVPDSKHDDLALWRMYGKENQEEARGCALTLNVKGLQKHLSDSLKGSDNPQGNETQQTSEIDDFKFYHIAYKKEGDEDCFIIPGAPSREEKLNPLMQALKNKLDENATAMSNDSDKRSRYMDLINDIAYLFKSIEYQYEHEIRLVVSGVGFTKKVEADDLSNPKVYIKLVPIKPLLQKITLAPKVARGQEWASTFYYSYQDTEHTPEIVISHLPFK